jgi:hypothetical protein
MCYHLTRLNTQLSKVPDLCRSASVFSGQFRANGSRGIMSGLVCKAEL